MALCGPEHAAALPAAGAAAEGGRCEEGLCCRQTVFSDALEQKRIYNNNKTAFL
jgi:hypothetical protein